MPVNIGKVCEKHPELNGQRRNSNCPACQRERVYKKSKPSPEVQQRKTKKYRAANAAKVLAAKRVRTRRKRMLQIEATLGDRVAIGIAYREMKRRAAVRGMTVDHIVPIAGCRICGLKGLHEPSNWQMITGSDNAAKGNRCKDCLQITLRGAV